MLHSTPRAVASPAGWLFSSRTSRLAARCECHRFLCHRHSCRPSLPFLFINTSSSTTLLQPSPYAGRPCKHDALATSPIGPKLCRFRGVGIVCALSHLHRRNRAFIVNRPCGDGFASSTITNLYPDAMQHRSLRIRHLYVSVISIIPSSLDILSSSALPICHRQFHMTLFQAFCPCNGPSSLDNSGTGSAHTIKNASYFDGCGKSTLASYILDQRPRRKHHLPYGKRIRTTLHFANSVCMQSRSSA